MQLWRLFFVPPLSVNASRIGEPFFEFLGMLGRLAFYIPQFSINVVAKFPGILTERAGLARRLGYLRRKFYRHATGQILRVPSRARLCAIHSVLVANISPIVWKLVRLRQVGYCW